MPFQFDHHIGIDYSGAGTAEARSKSIQVYLSTGGSLPLPVESTASKTDRPRNWNRIEVYEWLCSTLDRTINEGENCIIGVDHGFSFPISYFDRHRLNCWDDFLADFATCWPTDVKGTTVESLRSSSNRTGMNDEFRMTERWTSSAKSVFQFDVNGSVAKSTHSGLPFLHKLRQQFSNQLHCWPFDGWTPQPNHCVIAEVYPSIFRNRYPRDGRTVDQQDAFAISRWLMETDRDDHLSLFFEPPLDQPQREQARIEGWILGVM